MYPSGVDPLSRSVPDLEERHTPGPAADDAVDARRELPALGPVVGSLLDVARVVALAHPHGCSSPESGHSGYQ